MGELTVLGLGPGSLEKRTAEVQHALEAADLIVGYDTYVDPLKIEFPGKEFFTSGMMKEIDRCRSALEQAAAGKKTVMVSSGDAGVYGMASPILELAADFPDVQIRILPGITAATSGAALLGAPLSHDFAVISLSDRLTPWEEITRRVSLLAEANMPIVIYNPGSHSRRGYLKEICQILLKKLPADTPCGLARNIGRDGEAAEILTLSALSQTEPDMFTTVFIGDQTTRIAGGRMVTPRGYQV